MGVIQSDLCFYGSADMPDGDGVTTGGAVDFSTRVFFTNLSTGQNDIIYISSSSSDHSTTVETTGLDISGNLVSETITLTGTSELIGTTNFSQLLKGTIGGTIPVGDIMACNVNSGVFGSCGGGSFETATSPASIILAAGDGAKVAIGWVIHGSGFGDQLRRIIGISGDTVYVNRNWSSVPINGQGYQIFSGFLFEISPNRVSQIRRPFYSAAADSPGGSTRTYYEKIFAVNNNTAFALSNAIIQKTTDPVGAASYQFALTNSLNDTGTVANRQTAPTSGITGWTSGSAPQSIFVPSPGILPAGAVPDAAGAQGVWLSMTLNPGTSSSFTATNMTMDGSSL